MSKAYERVSRAITEDILSGRLLAGDRLPDPEAMALEYGVGLSTVRESLRVLDGRGWIRSVRGATGGVFVSEPEPEDVGSYVGDDLAFLLGGHQIAFDEVLEARHVHEEAAARFAALRAGPGEIQRIRSLARGAEDSIDDHSTFHDLNLKFHVAITEATHNRVLRVWMHAMHRVLSDAMHVATSTVEGRTVAAEQHVAIAQAISSRDPDRAGQAMRVHIEAFELHNRRSRVNHQGAFTETPGKALGPDVAI